ncbi:class I SAM-dependent methyltransferase [Spirosoma oryzicola]|uniref:class I SAM-dependent methyltransferase n=1 Tax=Spirosoma oryzicola TaxID=2898794 RepID=UPI001E31EE69|nr:class I SAM-dependent methyltransferase [Spirosoma oryzicola]UHG94443.1 class I SAM-dependent methyltransferase [Spirosoma oryzicola]
MDKSNGYEDIAARFIQSRTKTIGTPSVQLWARTLPPKATVLDLGCGTGLPVSEVLMNEGLEVYGIDASPTLAQAFHLNFPHSPVACEAVEESLFFDRQFDAIIAWGLLFLLTVDSQQIVIRKVAKALPSGGKFLFTSPSQAVSWKDALTACESNSLGAKKYKSLLSASGLRLLEEFDDEGGNHYFSAIKI